MRERLNKIKALFLDVDNTALCLKMYDNNGVNDKSSGKRIIGILDDKAWMEYNIKNNAYVYCEAPRQIWNLVQYVKKNGGKVYGLTECKNSFEYNAKYNRLRECYKGSFLHHGELISVHTRHDKIPVMRAIAERDNLSLDEIMFIDDSFYEVMEAHENGMLSMHTVEAMMRFDDEDLKDIRTNGIGKEDVTEKSAESNSSEFTTDEADCLKNVMKILLQPKKDGKDLKDICTNGIGKEDIAEKSAESISSGFTEDEKDCFEDIMKILLKPKKDDEDLKDIRTNGIGKEDVTEKSAASLEEKIELPFGSLIDKEDCLNYTKEHKYQCCIRMFKPDACKSCDKRIPTDFVYDCENSEFIVYKNKYTGAEIHIKKK